MKSKIFSTIFFMMQLFGIIALILDAFNIFKEPIQVNIYIISTFLGIGLIGSFVSKKYEVKKTEQEMKNFHK